MRLLVFAWVVDFVCSTSLGCAVRVSVFFQRGYEAEGTQARRKMRPVDPGLFG